MSAIDFPETKVLDMLCVSVALEEYADDYGGVVWPTHKQTVKFALGDTETTLWNVDPGQFIVGDLYQVRIRREKREELHDGSTVKTWYEAIAISAAPFREGKP